MNQQPEKIVSISLYDVMNGLKGMLSNELHGKILDELELRRAIPNLLKDDKKRVDYDPNNGNQHIYISDPKYPITVTHIKKETV